MIINIENKDMQKLEVYWLTPPDITLTSKITDVPFNIEFDFKMPDCIVLKQDTSNLPERIEVDWGNPPDITMINTPIEIKIDLKTIDINKDHGCVALVPYKI